MAWLKLDDNAPQHKKVLRVPPAARWLWICGLAYCQRLRTDGHIPAEALATFAVDKPKPLADALVAANLWHEDDGGYRVHDFLEWNDSADDRESKTAEKGDRQRRWREKKRLQRTSADDHVDASTGDAVDAAPTPPPTPAPPPREPRASASVRVETVPEPSGPRPFAPRRSRYGHSLVQPRNLSARWEGPIFDIPDGWAKKTIKASNGRATDADVSAFGAWLTDRLQRTNGEAPISEFLSWLDSNWTEFRTTQRAAAKSDAAVRQTDALLQEQAARRANLAPVADVLEGLRAGRARH
jgi:hypothetical protein